jgi:hypothetical protein
MQQGPLWRGSKGSNGLPNCRHQDPQIGYIQLLYQGQATGEGQHQKLPIRRKVRHHEHHPGVGAVPEVEDTRTAPENVCHVLMATTMGAGPIEHHAKRGQAALQGKHVVKESMKCLSSMWGENPDPHNLQ